MLALRRVFFDGSDRPELVLIHYEASPEAAPDRLVARGSLVLAPSTVVPGRREGRIFLPSPGPGGRLRLRYFFSTIGGGSEWFSPKYELAVPGSDTADDLVQLEETGSGNLCPAPGLGMFRLPVPARNGERSEVAIRYGFGAMRKKPSPSLCRLKLPAKGGIAVMEVPEALSVLKNRPMPFFLYHVKGDDGALAASKINSARLTLRDDDGSVVCARILWGDRSWKAQNFSVMEVKNFASDEWRASDYFFCEDRDSFIRRRAGAIGSHPVPRMFEAFVYGPEGSVVEYCYQLLLRSGDGSVRASWRNRDGGNWTITL